MRIARLLLLAFALIAAAWFALGLRQAIDLSRATAIVEQASAPTASQAAKATSQLHAAGALNPDNEVKLVQAELAIREGRNAEAKRILFSVVRQEPDNLVGWDLLAKISGHDRRTLLEAFRHIAALDRLPR